MKNFERYEEEIKKLNYRIAFDNENNKLCDCQYSNCANCKFEGDEYCGENIIKWLYEECEEASILTSREREYLRIVIKPFRNIIKYIQIFPDEIFIMYEDNTGVFNARLPIQIVNKDINYSKDYSLEELGL